MLHSLCGSELVPPPGPGAAGLGQRTRGPKSNCTDLRRARSPQQGPERRDGVASSFCRGRDRDFRAPSERAPPCSWNILGRSPISSGLTGAKQTRKILTASSYTRATASRLISSTSSTTEPCRALSPAPFPSSVQAVGMKYGASAFAEGYVTKCDSL